MRRTLILAFILFGLAPAQARFHGGIANTSLLPVVQNFDVNFGALTRKDQGAVPVSNLLLVSGVVDHWLACQSSGATAYFEMPTTSGSTQTVATVPLCSSSTVSVNENQVLAATTALNQTVISPDAAASDPAANSAGSGTGYAVSDHRCLSNGSEIDVAALSTGAVAPTSTTGIRTFTISKQPSQAVQGSGAVTDVGNAPPVNPTCTATGAGSGAKFTFNTYYPALTPAPNTTGANADLGGNSDGGTIAFTEKACPFPDGATCALGQTATLTYHLFQNGWNWAPSQQTLGVYGGIVPNSAFGEGTTNTLTAGVVAAITNGGVTNSSSNMRLLISTGCNCYNKNNGLNHDFAVEIFPQSLNPAFIENANGITPSLTVVGTSTGNDLKIMDACSASGSALYVGYTSCDPTRGTRSPVEGLSLAGTGSNSTACTLTNATTGTNNFSLNGIDVRGYPGLNYTSRKAMISTGGCNIAVNYPWCHFNTAYSAGQMLSSDLDENGNQYQVCYGVSAGGNHVAFNHVMGVDIGSGWDDFNASSSTAALDVKVTFPYFRRYFQNAIGLEASEDHISDYRVIAPTQHLGGGDHIDVVQQFNTVTSGTTPFDLTRGEVWNGDGTAWTQGIFYGSPISDGALPGSFIESLTYTGNSGPSCIKRTSADNTGSFIAFFKHVGCVRQVPTSPALNTGPLYSFLNLSVNPSDGDSFKLGVGCTISPPVYPSATCTDTQVTITFKNSPVGTQQIQIGATVADTLVNLQTAFGLTTATPNGNTCSVVTALNTLTNWCGAINSTGLIITSKILGYDPNTGLFSGASLVAGGTVTFQSTLANNVALGNTNTFLGPDAEFVGAQKIGVACNTSTIPYCANGTPISYDANYTFAVWGNNSSPPIVGCSLAGLQSAMSALTSVWTITNDNVISGADPSCAGGSGASSISGTTLTFPSGQGLTAGAWLYGAAGGLLDGTYVTANIDATHWTVNKSQSFPVGAGSSTIQFVNGKFYDLFAGDSISSPIQSELEATDWTTYHAMGDLTLCTFYKGKMEPKVGGGLTTTAGFGQTIGPFDTSGNWLNNGADACGGGLQDGQTPYNR
jgi:hypothetical protein